MASSYPSTQDVFGAPTSTTPVDSTTLRHSVQHTNLGDAIEALQAKLGYSSATSGSGLLGPSTSVGDVLHVSDTAGRSKWGPRAMTSIAAWDGTSTGVAAVTFSALRQDFHSLLIDITARSTTAGTFGTVQMQINGDTAANYRNQGLQGGPTTSLSGSEGLSATSINVGFCAANSSRPQAAGSAHCSIEHYTSTRFEKLANTLRGVFHEATSGAARINFNHGVWGSTAPATSLAFHLNTGGFAIGSCIRVYGLPE